jgi:hypothetical protein
MSRSEEGGGKNGQEGCYRFYTTSLSSLHVVTHSLLSLFLPPPSFSPLGSIQNDQLTCKGVCVNIHKKK